MDSESVLTEQMLIPMNSFNIETRVHRNKLLVTMQSSTATLGPMSVLQFMYVIHVCAKHLVHGNVQRY